jgi:protein-S-isoprenylcysteine O-methyltransferase Ste14
MKPEGTVAAIFERQWLHLLALAIALPTLWLISRDCPCLYRGEVWGITTWQWFWIAIEIPIAHQIYVWLCWRIELHSGLLSRVAGQFAFPLYGAVFMAFLVARFVAVVSLAIGSRNTLAVDPAPLRWLAGIIVVPVAYLIYSVVRFFTISRAMGADHFSESYRSRPLETRGIYRFTSNGMYLFGMMVLYLPALWYASRPALVAAVFGHLYIWVHYFTTEEPDMRRIYGAR